MRPNHRMMTQLALAAVVGSLHAVVVVSPAAAQSPNIAEGQRCQLSSATDPTAEGDVQAGQVTGGPLVATPTGATIQLTCTIQVGWANTAHAGADSATGTSAASLQSATLPPTSIQFAVPTGQPVYLCTSVEVNGERYYWDSLQSEWSPTPTAACDEARGQEIGVGEYGQLADEFATTHVDPVVCSLRSGQDWDLLDLARYDCPPYDEATEPGSRTCRFLFFWAVYTCRGWMIFIY